jgi:tRNA modification GTPase
LLTDTAGLRTSDDLVEQAGIGRARERMEQADGCLFVVDATAGWLPEDQAIADTLPLERTLLVIDKSDGLVDPAMAGAAYADRLPGSPHVVVSCHTGAGLDRLLEVVTGQLARIPDEGEGTIIMAARQQDVVQRLALELAEAVAVLQRDSAGMGTLELAALPLRSALDAIGELTGTVTREDVLARIFSQFCIGK